jgi:hypothetical protein
MTAYFNKTGWPANAPKGEQERKDFIASLHKRKTELFMELVEKKLLPLRPGVAKLVTIYLFFIYYSNFIYWVPPNSFEYSITFFIIELSFKNNSRKLILTNFSSNSKLKTLEKLITC